MQRGATEPVADSRAPAAASTWQRFLDGCRNDARVVFRARHVMKPAVVVLGGTHSGGTPELAGSARELGKQLGSQGVPLRIMEREGLVRDLVDSARAAGQGVRVEAIAHGEGAGATSADVRIATRTRELGKRLLMQDATAYVVMPGDLEALWELGLIWTLMKIDMIEHRPIVLVGDEAAWRAVLEPFTKAALANGTISKSAADLLVFAPTAGEAAKIAASAHGTHGARGYTSFKKLGAGIRRDAALGEKLMQRSTSTIVVLGGAALKPGQPAYERLHRVGYKIGGPFKSGLGFGAMEAPLKGAKERDPQAANEGVAIRIHGEPKTNDYVDTERHFVASVIEVRQRLLFENGKAHLFEEGGIGTFYELFHLLKLISEGELPRGPIVVQEYFKPTLDAYLDWAAKHGFADAEVVKSVSYYSSEDELVRHLDAASKRDTPTYACGAAPTT